MKTSNKLLLGLLAFAILFLIGTSFSLKAEFSKIDKNDSFYGYLHDTLTPFRYVKLDGKQFGVAQIQPGKTFEIRRIDLSNSVDHAKVSWTMVGDTLVVRYEREDFESPFNGRDIFTERPHLYILAPALEGISSNGIVSKVTGWPGGTFRIRQTGREMMLADNKFDTVSVENQAGATVIIKGTNQLGATSVLIRDSSSVVVEKDIFTSLQLTMDSTAHISLPGSLIRKQLNL
ncbi:hypothetical protein [Telluribacter sp. SYSU D00476]|uniref:hypothetical protein n=1 Tax=Telluribacter sp. SYSU D00476 TaxID=2811430 RepID=UPI001FF4B686|nr:hypothetical protein [Telluribacter sp. SYSU D00476]